MLTFPDKVTIRTSDPVLIGRLKESRRSIGDPGLPFFEMLGKKYFVQKWSSRTDHAVFGGVNIYKFSLVELKANIA